MNRSRIQSMCLFFIVSSTPKSVSFYQDKLGFDLRFEEPKNLPFFAIVGREGAMLFLKAGEAEPLPNSTRDPARRWDTYCFAPDPDALAAEFAGRHVSFSKALDDTADGLRGFEITDPDGYVIFFGRPR